MHEPPLIHRIVRVLIARHSVPREVSANHFRVVVMLLELDVGVKGRTLGRTHISSGPPNVTRVGHSWIHLTCVRELFWLSFPCPRWQRPTTLFRNVPLETARPLWSLPPSTTSASCNWSLHPQPLLVPGVVFLGTSNRISTVQGSLSYTSPRCLIAFHWAVQWLPYIARNMFERPRWFLAPLQP